MLRLSDSDVKAWVQAEGESEEGGNWGESMEGCGLVSAKGQEGKERIDNGKQYGEAIYLLLLI